MADARDFVFSSDFRSLFNTLRVVPGSFYFVTSWNHIFSV